MLYFIKKALGICFIGFGIGILLVLFLPIKCWFFLVGVAVVAVGIAWLCHG